MRVKVLNVETQSEVREISLEDSTARTGECLIGRSPDLGLVLESPDVSRLHGKFVRQDGQYTYYDLGSANGSLVNGHLAIANQPYLLKANDIVRIGEFTLMLREVQPMPEDLPATVMSGAEATVVGNSWQFLSNLPGLSSLVTEAVSPPSTPAVTPEPVLSTPVEAIDLLADETPAAVTNEAVDQGLMDALAAIAETTDSTDTAGSEAEIVDHTTTWGTPSSPVLEVEEPVAEESVAEESVAEEPVAEEPVAEEPVAEEPVAEEPVAEEPVVAESIAEAPVVAESIAEAPVIPEPIAESAAAEEAVAEPPVIAAPMTELPSVALPPEPIAESTPELASAEVALQTPEAETPPPDATVIQPGDLWETDLPQPESEPTVVQSAAVLEFADDATVVQPADLFASTAEPTVVQTAETVEASFSTSDATVYQGVIADTSEVPTTDAPSQDVWSTSVDDTVSSPVPTSVTESIAEPVTETVSDTIEPSVSEPVINFVPEATVVPVAEPVTEPPSAVAAVTAVDAAVDQPPAPEVPPVQPFGDRSIALLCHDSQLIEMTQFVERHRSFLSQCLTVSTPSISQALSAIGLEVSQQTPAVPPGGYQTVNSLVTSDKVLAVIFLRDFFTPQPTQANDEALTRSCNVHQVLLANNLPTAEAIVHYLENVMTGAVTL